MARPNPLIPVIVNVKTMGVNMPADYTRAFGLVSYGDTNLEKGIVRQVSKASVSEIDITEDSYTESFLNSFFTNNANGTIYLLETKKPAVPTIKQYKVGDYYIDTNKAYKCIKADTAISITDKKPNKLADTAYWEETQTVKSYAVSDVFDKGGKTYKCLKADTAKALTDLTPTNLTNTVYWQDITTDEVSQAVAVLKGFIDSEELHIYEWACPTAFYKNNEFIDLVKNYSGITQAQYFSIELPEGTNPDTDETFKLYNKSKSFAPVYPSLVENESSNGAVVGIKASSYYTLNSQNPLSLLQWKTVYGITPREKMSNSLITSLNNNGCTWIGSFNNNTVILGAMVADGKNWEYYFALDTFIFRLIADIGVMMIQASNNPLQAVKFNNDGIKRVVGKLKAISDTMVGFGVLDVYGSDYDTNTNAILNNGEWSYIAFAEYKANQYDDWKNGIYNGASCYATIGNFLLQIVPNITVE